MVPRPLLSMKVISPRCRTTCFRSLSRPLIQLRRLSTSGPPTIRPLQRTTTTSPTDRELSVRGKGSPQALNLSAGRLQTPMRCQHGRGF